MIFIHATDDEPNVDIVIDYLWKYGYTCKRINFLSNDKYIVLNFSNNTDTSIEYDNNNLSSIIKREKFDWN